MNNNRESEGVNSELDPDFDDNPKQQVKNALEWWNDTLPDDSKFSDKKNSEKNNS